MNDVPVRSIVIAGDGKWRAHCIDFNVQGVGSTPEDALDRLDEAIAEHVKLARSGQRELFRSAPEELCRQYFAAAAEKLFSSGPDHGHVEHRALLASVTTV